MKAPSDYILNEWEGMCAGANIRLSSDCPLLHDEVLVEMDKYITRLIQRINSLELLSVDE